MANQDEVEMIRRRHIEERAYELYLARGGSDGLDEVDWLQAEREIDGLPLDSDERLVAEDDEDQPRLQS